MDALRPIDMSSWPRAEHFRHYRQRVACTYSLTVDVDVTEFRSALAHRPYKTYVAQIWAIAGAVNRHEAFRMGLTSDGTPGIWDVVHPSFTVFNPDRETFASISAPFDDDFRRFHDHAAALLAEHRSSTEMFPQGPPAPNGFDISSLPWTSFSGFTLDVREPWDHLAPIFTLGKYRDVGGRTLLPLAVQIHHAAADGFHTAKMLEDLQQSFAELRWLD